MLFVIAICHPVCESKMILCISLTFFFIHSLILFLPSFECVCVCVCVFVSVHVRTHGWGSSGFQTDVQWQHLKRAGDLGQWATHVSCIHLRWVFLSSPFCLFFPDLSITNSASCRNGVTGSPCKHSSEIDRQVRKLIAVQDTSAGAQHYSSYTLPAFPPLHLPGSMWGALPHSFASKLLFLPCSRSWKAGVLAGFHWLLWRSSPNIGLAWKTQQVHHQQHQLLPDWRGLLSQLWRMLSASPHINSSVMFCVWGILCPVFGEFICITGQKGSFMTPRVYSVPSWKWRTYCLAALS